VNSPMLVETRTKGAALNGAQANSKPVIHNAFLIIRSPYLTRGGIP